MFSFYRLLNKIKEKIPISMYDVGTEIHEHAYFP